MAKFDINKIRGKKENESMEESSSSTTMNVGMGLLNETSKPVLFQKTEYIKVDDIEPNDRNKLSMKRIDELAQLIEISGLEQPLVVRKLESGKYRLITGHRRLEAIKLLISQEKWNSDNVVEVKIKDFSSMNVPLSDEDKETFSWLNTNQTREKTDADKAVEVAAWNDLISKLRSQGLNMLPIGQNEEGETVFKDITGVKSRDIVAEQMNISPAQVAKFVKVENNASDALKNALLSDKVNIAVADQVARLPKNEQDEFIKANENKETIKQEDLKSFSNSKNEEYLIDEKSFKNDIKDIVKLLKQNEVRLKKAEYENYKKKLDELRKIL